MSKLTDDTSGAVTSPASPPAAAGGVGSSMLRSLAGSGYGVQMKALAPRAAVQKKAVIGADYKQPQETNEKVKGVIGDDKPRRFKTQGELDGYAENRKANDAGEMKDGTWIRLDEMHVLGENHGARVAPDILSATGTRRFRYEAAAHHSKTRLGASPALKKNIDEVGGDKLEKLSGKPQKDEPTHEAEHALPKYARIVADVAGIATAQTTVKKEFAKCSVVPGRVMDEEYSVVKSLVEGFLTALLYAQSYKDKFFGHELKAFYKANAATIDATITAMQQKPNEVPDLSAIAGALGDMTTAYKTAALKKLGLNKEGAVTAFKNKLVKGVDDQAETNEAKELDYLRDASMLDTIKQAKGAGDKLFIIGDAHRRKLQTEVEGLGIKSMRDTAYVEEQQKLNADTGRGITQGDRTKQDQSRKLAASGAYKPSPTPVWVNDTFTLKSLAALEHCAWRVGGADLVDGVYTAKAERVYLHIDWSHGGVTEPIWHHQLDLKIKAKDRRAITRAPPSAPPKAPTVKPTGDVKGEPDGD